MHGFSKIFKRENHTKMCIRCTLLCTIFCTRVKYTLVGIIRAKNALFVPYKVHYKNMRSFVVSLM